MRNEETGRRRAERSSAVSRLRNRPGDVDRTIPPAGRGTRTSTMATRTTTTRTTSCAPAPSADRGPFSFAELVEAYLDCRRTKRNSNAALAFEMRLERNLRRLYDELADGSYMPGRSKCFVITRPKPREVWAAAFRDRIVHHLLYNRIGPRFERSFIADSCACIKGRGTLYAAERLESKVRSITQNWSRRAFYLKCDLANFFVSIDKRILLDLLLAKISEPSGQRALRRRLRALVWCSDHSADQRKVRIIDLYRFRERAVYRRRARRCLHAGPEEARPRGIPTPWGYARVRLLSRGTRPSRPVHRRKQ